MTANVTVRCPRPKDVRKDTKDLKDRRKELKERRKEIKDLKDRRKDFKEKERKEFKEKERKEIYEKPPASEKGFDRPGGGFGYAAPEPGEASSVEELEARVAALEAELAGQPFIDEGLRPDLMLSPLLDEEDAEVTGALDDKRAYDTKTSDI
jgi:hypothetical protein